MKLISEGKLIRANYIHEINNYIRMHFIYNEEVYVLLDVLSVPIFFRQRFLTNKNVYLTRDMFKTTQTNVVRKLFEHGGEEEIKIDNTPQLYNGEKGIIEIENLKSYSPSIAALQFTLTSTHE
jgi:hypothetical protein